MIRFCFFAILALTMLSCRFDNKSKTANNGFVLIPQSLETSIYGDRLSVAELQVKYIGQKKIVSVINSDCSACHSEIWAWKRLMQKHVQLANAHLILVLYGDNFNPPTRLFANTDFNNFTFLIDKERTFYSYNNLRNDKSLSTFLVDSVWKIITPCNPVYSDVVLDSYLSVLSKDK